MLPRLGAVLFAVCSFVATSCTRPPAAPVVPADPPADPPSVETGRPEPPMPPPGLEPEPAASAKVEQPPAAPEPPPDSPPECHGTRLALVVLIDRSGVMNGKPLTNEKAAAINLLRKLQDRDLVEIIAFDAKPVRVAKLRFAQNRRAMTPLIEGIKPGSGSEIFAALDAAYQDLSVVAACEKRVLLMMGGVSIHLEGVRDLATALASERISVSTIATVYGGDEVLLKMIADTSGGRFRRVADDSELSSALFRMIDDVPR